MYKRQAVNPWHNASATFPAPIKDMLRVDIYGGDYKFELLRRSFAVIISCHIRNPDLIDPVHAVVRAAAVASVHQIIALIEIFA